jgi:hypothetical protein
VLPGALYVLQQVLGLPHIRHTCHSSDRLWSTTEILGYDEKPLHLFHLYSATGTLVAIGEHLTIHVRNGKIEPAPAEMLGRLPTAMKQAGITRHLKAWGLF